jgi:hypothetical protein
MNAGKKRCPALSSLQESDCTGTVGTIRACAYLVSLRLAIFKKAITVNDVITG